MTTVLMTAGVVVIVVLAAYAAYLHWQLYLQRKQQSGQAVEVFDPQQNTAGQRVELRKSLYLLADAMLDDKMTSTEGCLRICAMASYLEDAEAFRQEYGVLFCVAEATAHIPILDDWKALSRDQQQGYNKERHGVEQKYEEAVKEAAERLRSNFFIDVAHSRIKK